MSRLRTLITVLVLLGLPVALALAEGGAYYLTNRSNGTLVSSG